MKDIQILNNGDALYDIRRKINENFELVQEEFEEAIVDPLVKFSANSGNETNGVADLITRTGNTLNFKVGGQYPNLIATSGSGATYELTSLEPLYLQNLQDGKYIIMVTATSAQISGSTFYYQLVEPTNINNGDVWFNGEGALQYLKIGDAVQWLDYPYAPIGEAIISGGQVTSVITYPYNANGLHQASSSTFGLLRTAAEPDELNCHCQEAVLTPANLYSLNNYRTMNTSYEVDDKVGCPYHHNLQLRCSQAGTTTSEPLDTKGELIAGATIQDGTVVWKIEELGTGGGGASINDKITNCLLEVPQNIKLELVDGVLTLKAGSKVIVPNGFEEDGVTPRFDYVMVQSDYNYDGSTAIGNEQLMVVYSTELEATASSKVTTCYSGATDPQPTQSGAFWYDTANNIIKRWENSQWNTLGYSLSIAVATNGTGTGGSFTSLDQIFNGIGYIGSTIWVDKGVKGLIPDGRNTDGTLKNIEFTTPNVLVRTFTQTFNAVLGLKSNYIGQLRLNDYSFDYENNYCMNTDMTWEFAIIGSFTQTNGVISNFQPQLPIRLADTQVINELETKIDTKLETKLNKSQITNCLLEVPQNIKLELKDGTLTLKAGSVVIVPNGFEANGVTMKFDYVEVSSDTVISPTGGSGVCLACVGVNGTVIGFGTSSSTLNCVSGEGVTPKDYGMCYDISTNIIQRWGRGTISMNKASLPLAKVTQTNGVITSIDQVFNGMGYIGSTIWVDKGIKGLSSNGRNYDGTLNNIESVSNRIFVSTDSNIKNATRSIYVEPNGNLLNLRNEYCYISDTQPNFTSTGTNNWYNGKDNKSYTYVDGQWTERPSCKVCDFVYDANNTVAEVVYKQPLRAVDYNELHEVHCVVETYTNGVSGYRIWSDGWCEQWGRTAFGTTGTVTVTLLKHMRDTNYNCQVSLFGETGGYGNTIQGVYHTCWNLTTTSFQHQRYNADTLQQMWKVSGYIA